MDQGVFGQLVKELSRLPGLGPRSARRIALHLLTRGKNQAISLPKAIAAASETMKTCGICGHLDDQDPCSICCDTTRDPTRLCIVAGVADVWAMERTRQFRGRYHVLGGVLSALDGITPELLRLGSLGARLSEQTKVEEIVFALPATVDGQTTIHYVADRLRQEIHDRPLTMTRLALGMPLGGELDFMDDGTLVAALRARTVA